jgi:post-segregation antitoxin (ccd killing protein)
MNPSQFLKREFCNHMKDEGGRRWAEENKEFIESYNAYIERNGVFGEELQDLDDPPDGCLAESGGKLSRPST